MFDNLLYQNVAGLLKADIASDRLPGAILLSGPSSSGKLTCALELARVAGCVGDGVHSRGHWLCECSCCKKNKELSSQNVVLAGPRDCSLEILAAKKAFLQAAYNNYSYLTATTYLFVRAVRKLTMRFSQILWEDDDKISKISPILQAIDEDLEKISPQKELPETDKLEKICSDIVEQCEKLESKFMYDSLPINQIRKASLWARMTSSAGKKVLIIENAERMQEATRNALLKILEEPPADTIFILTTSRRGSVMQTILSRVRTYNFSERTELQQKEVIERVFHARDSEKNTVDSYLQGFLPKTPEEIDKVAAEYYNSVKTGVFMPADKIVKACNGFEPRFLLKLFLIGIMNESKPDSSPQSAELSARNIQSVRDCFNNVTIYNQTPAAAIERLTRDLAVNKKLVR